MKFGLNCSQFRVGVWVTFLIVFGLLARFWGFTRQNTVMVSNNIPGIASVHCDRRFPVSESKNTINSRSKLLERWQRRRCILQACVAHDNCTQILACVGVVCLCTACRSGQHHRRLASNQCKSPHRSRLECPGRLGFPVPPTVQQHKGNCSASPKSTSTRPCDCHWQPLI